jgi:predicted dehydrogenase
VVCEKPIGIAKEQLDLIGRACKEIKFAAISQLYFSGAFQKALAAVKSGRLGRLILGDLSMKYHRNGQYYQGWHGTASMDGGGALMNQGIHGISALLHLMGPVKSVTALTRTLIHSIEVEDTAVAVVEFENNALGNIIGTTSIQPASPRILSIHGTKGTIALTEDAISQWDIQGETEIVDSEAGTVSAASDPTNFTAILHQRQLEDFIDAIECDRPPKLGYKEGRAPVDLILAMYESSRTGKTVYIT